MDNPKVTIIHGDAFKAQPEKFDTFFCDIYAYELSNKVVEDYKKFSEVFTKQIEMRESEAEENKNRIKELEEKLQQNELEKLELKHELELEKNKSFWKKLFK